MTSKPKRTIRYWLLWRSSKGTTKIVELATTSDATSKDLLKVANEIVTSFVGGNDEWEFIGITDQSNFHDAELHITRITQLETWF